MSFSFRPKTPTEQDDFDILWDNVVVGTLFWKRNHPRPNDKVAVVRDTQNNIAVRPDERAAQQWLVENGLATKQDWAVNLVESLRKKGVSNE